jgi:hypothetical protein
MIAPRRKLSWTAKGANACRPFGTCAIPRMTRRWGLSPSIVHPANANRAACCRQYLGDRAQEGCLPGAIYRFIDERSAQGTNRLTSWNIVIP